MFETIKIAISPGVLPLTLVLLLMIVFWIICLLGALDFDMFAFDGGSGGFDSGDGPGTISGSSRWLIRYLNGDVVPLAAVLSILLVFEWSAVMLGHFFFPPAGIGPVVALYGIGLIPALLLTKLTTRLIRPLFIGLQGLEGEAAPVIGRLGKVRSGTCDEKSGQVEVDDPEHPLLINARLATGSDPLPRGSRVIVESHHPESNFYIVHLHTEQP